MRSTTAGEIACRIGRSQRLVEQLLADEVRLGRVDRDGDRYRLRLDAFEPEIVLAIVGLDPVDLDRSRPARQATRNPRAVPA